MDNGINPASILKTAGAAVTGMAAGVYFDTLLIYVEGVANNPRRGIATLIIQQPSSPPGDSLVLTPGLVEQLVRRIS